MLITVAVVCIAIMGVILGVIVKLSEKSSSKVNDNLLQLKSKYQIGTRYKSKVHLELNNIAIIPEDVIEVVDHKPFDVVFTCKNKKILLGDATIMSFFEKAGS